MKANLLLNNGMVFEGISVGAAGTAFGEISFNTAMAGYQEILTDPSYTSQIIVLTYPEIGNCGINDVDFENERVYAKGLVMKNYCYNESHYQSKKSLEQYLKENNVIGIYGVDTRQITTIIRDNGTMPCIITTEEITDKLKTELSNWTIDKNLAQIASKGERYHIEGTGHKVAVIDLGLKNSILKNLINLNCDIHVYPADVTADEIIKDSPDAVLLSNGPGDPRDAISTIEMAQNLIKKVPLYGICLGFQVLSLAIGAKVTKLKYGHRGNNNPVFDLVTQKVFLTTQNHGYVVDSKTLPENAFPMYRNLNDGSLEGFCAPMMNIEAVQFHPEAAPNSTDTMGIFDRWIEQIEGFKVCQRM